jgi:N-methylhydantoinase A/oxoprolinase/acetone carboxylase beta subunit
VTASIEIDIGGTFTDCYVRSDDREVWCKARTTPFDLAQGMSRAIDDAAGRLGLSTGGLLADTDIIRYSTTLAMNKLIERKGPRLGLIVTEGFEDTVLVGRASQWSDGIPFKEQRNIAGADKPEPLIPRELTVGVKERVDFRGQVLRPLDETHLLSQLDRLVDAGVRGFVVSLLWSFMYPEHEQRIRELIEHEYNETYLGSMPVFLSSEISPRKFEYTRTTMTILNAYLHQSMYEELIGIGQGLRGGGYRKPLMMVHNTGGMASVFRSAAVHTYNGGPVAGLMGSAALGRSYGHSNVVVTDMGGTSFDIAMVVEGSTRFYQFAPTIDRWTIDATILDTRSIGSGGGSIASVDPMLGNRLDVGPESAGSIPGPAAYDQGGAGADGRRCRPGARLPQPGALPRRSAGAQRPACRARDPRGRRPSAGDRGARGGAADQADHRRQDGRRDLQADRAQGL